MAGPFCRRLSAVNPPTEVCKAAKAIFTWSTLGLRASDIEPSVALRLVLTLAIAVFSAVRPSSAGFTSERAWSDVRSVARLAQAVVIAELGPGGGALVGAGLVLQLARAQSRAAAAAAAETECRTGRVRIWVPKRVTVGRTTHRRGHRRHRARGP